MDEGANVGGKKVFSLTMDVILTCVYMNIYTIYLYIHVAVNYLLYVNVKIHHIHTIDYTKMRWWFMEPPGIASVCCFQENLPPRRCMMQLCPLTSSPSHSKNTSRHLSHALIANVIGSSSGGYSHDYKRENAYRINTIKMHNQPHVECQIFVSCLSMFTYKILIPTGFSIESFVLEIHVPPSWLLLSQRVWCKHHLNAGRKQLWIQISNAIIPKITHQTTKPQLLPFHFLPPNCCFQYHCRFHGSLKQRCQKRQSLYPGRHVFTCTDAGIEGNHLMLGQVHKEWMWNWNYNSTYIYIV